MVFTLNISATNRVIRDWKIDEIILPTRSGSIGILPNHAHLFACLDLGLLRVRSKNKWTPLIVSDGLVEVRSESVKIIVREVQERSDIKIDLDQAGKNLDQAISTLTSRSYSYDPEEERDLYTDLLNYQKARAQYQLLNFELDNKD